MHTTASTQYFWRIRTSVFFVYQQKFNIEAVNDYPPIRFEIRFERKCPIRRCLISSNGVNFSKFWAGLFTQKMQM